MRTILFIRIHHVGRGVKTAPTSFTDVINGVSARPLSFYLIDKIRPLMGMSGDYPLDRARAEVASCISIWRRIIAQRFADRIEYAYVKGSSTKDGESPIDYVPELSDVDIHIKPREGCALITAPRPFEEALDISRGYEGEFLREPPPPPPPEVADRKPRTPPDSNQ
jgi:hypothetical protein